MFYTLIKKFPPLLFIIRLLRTGFMTRQDVMLALPHYNPLAEGPQRFRARITLLAAAQTDPLLAELVDRFSPSTVSLVPIAEFCHNDAKRNAAARLADMFTLQGSDKSTSHDYHLFYGALLAGRINLKLNILEIGLGTNNTKILANMGARGRPGASLRAFRDFLPNSLIFGADIDHDVLFHEDRIETYPVDQLNRDSFDELADMLGNRKFDLIIDDGLHVPNANLETLIFGLDHLNDGGVLVIEDISDQSLPIWKIVSTILSEHYQTHIVRAHGGNIFVVAQKQEKLRTA